MTCDEIPTALFIHLNNSLIIFNAGRAVESGGTTLQGRIFIQF